MNQLTDNCSQAQAIPGMQTRIVDRLTHQEFHLTLLPLPKENPAEMVYRLAAVLQERDAGIVRHEIFGPISTHSETISALKREFGRLDWPVTWVEGQACTSQSISGMHVFAVAGTQVDTIELDGKIIGRIYDGGALRHCLIGDIKPSERSFLKEHQCYQTFMLLERALGEAGMGLANLVRTSFYLDDILSWYGEFNDVRNAFFEERNLLLGNLPASTGVGGRNPFGTALVAGAWAAQDSQNALLVSEVSSPLQCRATEYGSAFSRAVLLEENGCRRLLISGTASISPEGRSVHIGDVHKQIAKTMEAVGTILAAQGFEYSDVTRATAYFKKIEDAPAFDRWMKDNGLGSLPHVKTPMDICREELLFEIEVDTISRKV